MKLAHAKDYSQSGSQSNTCGSGFRASEVLCSNEQSEIQGDKNIASGFAGQTSEPSGKGSYDTNKIGKERIEWTRSAQQRTDWTSKQQH
jgi:hypothetical protein